MQLLYYAKGSDQANKRLEAAIHQAVPERPVERFQSLKYFQERLRMPVEPDSIAVLFAANQSELRWMQRLRGLLPEIYVILVLPDRAKRTIELAHLLLPRFLSQKSDDFSLLGHVLGKMAHQSSC
jgi:hypothetical protein